MFKHCSLTFQTAEEITILAAYLGQTKILRQKLRQAKEKYPELFGDEMISVQTIDMYQGDENKVVIVSLVRSGVDGIGFLDSLNRRCVAQSRAKCGLYFVGNIVTLSHKTNKHSGKVISTVWHPLIQAMTERGCVGAHIQTHCPDHPLVSKHALPDAESILAFVTKPESFCKVNF
jgi:helicase required for RNAi-mediated heterochromatin assembly 1